MTDSTRRLIVRSAALGLLVLATCARLSAQPADPARALWERYLAVPSVGASEWSPTGLKMAHVAPVDGRPRLFVTDLANGGAPREVAQGTSPRWAPDGQRLAYLGQGDIWVVSTDGSAPVRITNDPDVEREVEWSPDGRRLAFMSARGGSQDVWVVDATAGATPRRLTTGAMDADEVRFGARWAPDGATLAYVSNKAAWDRDDVWLVPAAGGEPRRLTTRIRARGTPAWSPDGRALAVNAFLHEEFTYGDMTDLYVVDAATGVERRLELGMVTTGSPVWSPDGRELYFSTAQAADTNLWRVALDAERHPTQVTYLEGTVGDYGLSHDGQWLAYLHNAPEHPAALVVRHVDGTRERVLASTLPPGLPVVRPRSVAYRSYDGKYIHGYLFLPPGAETGDAKYPALVQVHGGGTNLYRNGFNAIEQALAQKGFVVLAINYRGSSSYGRPFQDLSTYDWCGGQAHDAAMAAAYLRGLPYTNGKVGIYGYSYGGIMSMAAAVRHPEAFDAAVPMGGIYDWALAYDAADRVGKLFYELGHGGSPKTHPEAYERSSAINKIAALKAPVLEMHGEADVRAPFNQQTALRQALERHGKTHEVVSYPGEPHGFRRLENRVDMYSRLEKWFNRYLR